MKCYLFVPTGETRAAHKGEWVNLLNNFSQINDGTLGVYSIYHRHEIEVPDNTPKLLVCRGGEHLCYYPIKEIVIKHFKPKVKKWIWVYAPSYNNPTIGIITNNHLTEEEIKHLFPNRAWYHKIPETEIEEDA